MVVHGAENKDSIVRYLNQIGARDVLAAESLSFVTASVQVVDMPELSLRDEVRRIGDGELTVNPDLSITLDAVDSVQVR